MKCIRFKVFFNEICDPGDSKSDHFTI